MFNIATYDKRIYEDIRISYKICRKLDSFSNFSSHKTVIPRKIHISSCWFRNLYVAS